MTIMPARIAQMESSRIVGGRAQTQALLRAPICTKCRMISVSNQRRQHLPLENLRRGGLNLFRGDNQRGRRHHHRALRDQKAVALDAVVDPDATAAGRLRYNSSHEKLGYADHLGKLQFRLLTHGHPRPKARGNHIATVDFVTEEFSERKVPAALQTRANNSAAPGINRERRT